MRRAWPLIIVLLAGCATIRALFPEERPPFIPPAAAHISGAHSRAVGVAYEDWMADRAEQRATRHALEDAGEVVFHPEIRASQECLDRPDGYQTWVYPSDAGTSYVVVILIQEGVCVARHEEGPYYGDYMRYEIDAKTFEILKKEVEE